MSIQALGARTALSQVYGRIEAYNADNELIGFDLSNRLVRGASEVISVSSADNDIAYALAYSDTDTFPGSSQFGRFDRFEYSQLEHAAVTDADGQYEIKSLFPGQYEVVIAANGSGGGAIGGLPRPITITRFENFVRNQTLRPNVPPQVDPEFTFTVDENIIEGSPVGVVTAFDFDRQMLTYEISDGAESGLLIDATTGLLTVGPDAVVDFERDSSIELTVSITDGFATSTTDVTVNLNDLNEPPEVDQGTFFIAERTPDNTTIGQIEAVDPDTSLGQSIAFQVIGGTGQDIFRVDPADGLVTLVDGSQISFETLQELNLIVRISDTGSPPAVTEIDQRIRVIDQNDPPVITSTQLQIAENLTGAVARLTVSDPDSEQTHAYELRGGTGAEVFRVRRDGIIEVREGAQLDFEQVSDYTIEVIAIDSGAPPLAVVQDIDIEIRDVNEAPTLNLQSASVPENSEAGTPVADLDVVDPENSGSTYRVTLLPQPGDGSENFVFDSTTNLLTVAQGAMLDFESNRVTTLTFEIEDLTGDDGVTTAAFQVELTDQNDAPIILTEEVVLSELAQPGTQVGKLEVQIREPDSSDQVIVEITGGNAADLFTLNPNTRVLSVADGATFDADGDPDPLTLEVRVTDSGTPPLSSSSTIDIVLNDVNEPPQFVGTLPVVPPVVSGQPLNVIIPGDLIVDPEAEPFRIQIFGADGTLPPWLTFDEATGTLFGLPSPLEVGTFDLTLRAFEAGPLNLFNDLAFSIEVQQGDTPLTNQRDRLDVDNNGEVAALDALRIINYFDRFGSTINAVLDEFFGFVDTSGDGSVTPQDALLVINRLQDGLQNPLGFVGESIGHDDDRDRVVDEALVDLTGESSLF